MSTVPQSNKSVCEVSKSSNTICSDCVLMGAPPYAVHSNANVLAQHTKTSKVYMQTATGTQLNSTFVLRTHGKHDIPPTEWILESTCSCPGNTKGNMSGTLSLTINYEGRHTHHDNSKQIHTLASNNHQISYTATSIAKMGNVHPDFVPRMISEQKKSRQRCYEQIPLTLTS